MLVQIVITTLQKMKQIHESLNGKLSSDARPSELPELAKEKPWASRRSGRERRQKLKDSPC